MEMSSKQDKLIRKANQVQKKDLTKLVDKVIERQMMMPLKKRWKLALKILMSKDKYLLILLFIISQLLALFVWIAFINLFYIW